MPQMTEIIGPRQYEHADEEWPDCTDAGPAPPSGVHFEDEQLQDSPAYIGRLGTHMTYPGSPVFNFNKLARMSIQLSGCMGTMTLQEVHDLLYNPMQESAYTDYALFKEEGGEEPALVSMLCNMKLNTYSEGIWDSCAAMLAPLTDATDATAPIMSDDTLDPTLEVEDSETDATGDAPSGIDAAGGAATPDTEGSDSRPESSPAMLER